MAWFKNTEDALTKEINKAKGVAKNEEEEATKAINIGYSSSDPTPTSGKEGETCISGKSGSECVSGLICNKATNICMNNFDNTYKNKSWDLDSIKEFKLPLDNPDHLNPSMCKQKCTDNPKCTAWEHCGTPGTGCDGCYNFTKYNEVPTQTTTSGWYAGLKASPPKNLTNCKLDPNNKICAYPGYSDDSCIGYGKTKDNKNINISTCACDKDSCWSDYCWNFVGKLKKNVKKENPFKNKTSNLCDNVLNDCRKSINVCKNFENNSLGKLRCKNIAVAYSGIPVRYTKDKSGNYIISQDSKDDCLFDSTIDASNNTICNIGKDALNYMVKIDGIAKTGGDILKTSDVMRSLLCNIATSVYSKPSEMGCKSNAAALDISNWFYTNIYGASTNNHDGTQTSKWTYIISLMIYILFFVFFILNIAGSFNNVFNHGTIPSLYSKKGSMPFMVIFISLIILIGFTPYFVGVGNANDNIISNLNPYSNKTETIDKISIFESDNLENEKINQSKYVSTKIVGDLTIMLIAYGIIVAILYILLKGALIIGIIGSIVVGIIIVSAMSGGIWGWILGISACIAISGLSTYLSSLFPGFYPKIFDSLFNPVTFIITFALLFIFVIVNYLGGFLGTVMPSIMILLTILQKIFDTSWGNTKKLMSGNPAILSYWLPNVLIKTGVFIFSLIGFFWMSTKKNKNTKDDDSPSLLKSNFIQTFLYYCIILIIIQYVMVMFKTVSAAWFPNVKQNKYFLSNYLVKGWLPFGMSALYYVAEFLIKIVICGNSGTCGGYEGLFNFFTGINTD